ncbi:hypothetical protein NDU88_007083 [Pleurodeles waltl]|uniref:Uncharacterized protein n=1 Tax=Pleurodeles waltl TaxID=8319 RepID=A0AAV7NS45_PLEWA|nr:hypothetical protein NDU88_007083 [Pleurodeles waltl]
MRTGLRPSVAGRGWAGTPLLLHIPRLEQVENQLNQLERSLTDPKEDLRTDPIMSTGRTSMGINDMNQEAQVGCRPMHPSLKLPCVAI